MPLLLGDAEEAAGGFAHLGDRAGCRAELRLVERLDRVDDADFRALASSVAQTSAEVRLGEDVNGLAAAEPVGAELDLGRRLLAGDEERPALATHAPGAP